MNTQTDTQMKTQMKTQIDTSPAVKELNNIMAKTTLHTQEKLANRKIYKLIESTKEVDFNSLAAEYLGKKLLNSKGNLRSPNFKEAAVIVTEHLRIVAESNQTDFAKIDGETHYFTGTHWQSLETEELETILGQFAEMMGHSVTESRYYESRKKLAEQLRTIIPKISQPKGKTIVNFSNGTLELNGNNQNIRPHTQQDAFTYVLPFVYDSEAKCPNFDTYLERVLPDGECRTLLAEFFGWIFLRDHKLEKVLILLGHGHNGKSVLFDIITALLGSNNISSIGFDSLRKPESRLPMLGKLLNYGSEIAGNVSPDILKKASSGEPLEFRRLYHDPVTSDNYARLAYNANNLPSLTEQTTGFYRRFLIIPFEQTITEEEKDPNLARKIISNELSGVMNWVLEGMHRVASNNAFSPCSKSDECLKEYKLNSDSVALFLDEEGYIPSIENQISKADLHDHYKSYCWNNGYKPCAKRGFGERLEKQHGFIGDRNKKERFWEAELKK